MPRSLKKFREANRLFSQLPCNVPGCTKNRAGVSPYCHNHTRRNTEYGHPLGLPLPRTQYAKELDEVRKLFADHSTHPGLLSVCQWIDDWIEEASKGEAQTGNKLLGRIHVKRVHGNEGLTALDIVTEIAAVWVYSRRYPTRLPDDQRLTFALSRNVARLATFEKQMYGKWKCTKTPTATELRAVGERIRQVLALFILTIEEGLRKQTEKAAAFRESLSIPFIY